MIEYKVPLEMLSEEGVLGDSLPRVPLSKREHFAGLALLATIGLDMSDQYKTAPEWVKCTVETAVEFADALLEELEATDSKELEK
jgi:hypothetical protein